MLAFTGTNKLKAGLNALDGARMASHGLLGYVLKMERSKVFFLSFPFKFVAY